MKESNLPILDSKFAKIAPDTPSLKFKMNRNPPRATPGAKFVLFIGDDGAILTYIKGNKVQSRQFVPDGNPEHVKELQATLAKNIRAPVFLVVDNMDQAYVQQTLPPVSLLSINKLIKRRLDRDFASSDIKGAIMLGREPGGRKDWNFMMVALEKSPQLSVWIEFVSELPNRLEGIYLVPAEAELIIKDIETAIGVPKEGTGAQWKFFVSHNKVGGVRQVIMRNGRLTFTRMTQLVGESTPEVIAGNIEQEILGTLEYMRRLGFNPQAGLDIYIIASNALKPFIDQSKFAVGSMHIMAPYEVAQYLGFEGATQPADQFGDVVLAAAIGCSKKHILRLTTPLARRFDRLYKTMLFQRAVAVLISLGIIGYAGSVMFGIYSTYAKKDELEQVQIAREATLTALRSQIRKSNLDVEKTGDLIALYTQLEKERATPVPFIAKIGAIIKRPIEIKAIKWSLDDSKAATETPRMTAVLTLDFPGVDTLEAFKVISKKVLADLKDALGGADIKFTRLPVTFSETEKMDISLDNDKQAAGAGANGNSSDVELTIKSDLTATLTAMR